MHLHRNISLFCFWYVLIHILFIKQRHLWGLPLSHIYCNLFLLTHIKTLRSVNTPLNCTVVCFFFSFNIQSCCMSLVFGLPLRQSFIHKRIIAVSPEAWRTLNNLSNSNWWRKYEGAQTATNYRRISQFSCRNVWHATRWATEQRDSIHPQPDSQTSQSQQARKSKALVRSKASWLATITYVLCFPCPPLNTTGFLIKKYWTCLIIAILN